MFLQRTVYDLIIAAWIDFETDKIPQHSLRMKVCLHTSASSAGIKMWQTPLTEH